DKEPNTVSAIELDDKSHYMDEKQHQENAKKDKALTAAGIRIIRWRRKIMRPTEQIKINFLTTTQMQKSENTGHEKELI
ncbi:DUF2726 domain-containing protein, partial [Escherichia coli]